jgi:PadR family transcriptional regulator
LSDAPPRLSEKEWLIMEMLLAAREMYGLEMVEASEGRLKRGTVYVTLGRMADKGYVSSRQAERAPGETGLPRRLYRATPRGIRVTKAWAVLKRDLAWGGAV